MSLIYSPRLMEAMATLDQAVDWERRDRGLMRVDTQPVRDLLKRLRNPQHRFRAVHVAGTKGKGSVCALIEEGLRRAGKLVGRYASPHVERVNERIVLDGRQIGDELLADYLFKVLAARNAAIKEGTAAHLSSWFDIWTAATFVAFAAYGVEWAVVECGLGGERDSTNVLDGDVAVLTNVDLEHTEVLGSSCEAIAREKLGIVRPGRLVVSGVSAASPLGGFIQREVGRRGGRLLHVDPSEPPSLRSDNLRVANAVLGALGLPPLDRAAADSVSLPGRQERLLLCREGRSAVHVVLDGAHVASSMRALVAELQQDQALRGRCIVVFALGRDKPLVTVLAELAPLKAQGLTVLATAIEGRTPQHSIESIKAEAAKLGIASTDWSDPCRALADAISRATSASDGPGWVLVTGSLHLIGSVRPSVHSMVTSIVGS